jgi:predicted amidophosphoribosyltransferase
MGAHFRLHAPRFPHPARHHVELFCSELAFVSGAAWPVERLLVKVAETEPMSNKSRAVRRRVARSHLPGAMRPAPGAAVRGRRLLLVDDVSASGETLLVAARALRGAGAAEVAALVLARAAWRAPALGAGP